MKWVLKGTKLTPHPAYGQGGKGTSLSQFKPNKAAAREAMLGGDPLGSDPLTIKMGIDKAATLQMSGKDFKALNRGELLSMKRDLKRLLQAVEKLSKSNPELGSEAKQGNKASKEICSAPGDESLEREEDKAAYRFEDLGRDSSTELMGAAR